MQTPAPRIFDALAVERALAAHGESLCRALLPYGRRDRNDRGTWRDAGRAAGGRGETLTVALAGDGAGLWRDAATGAGGDLLDLIALVETDGDRAAALAWAAQFLAEPVAGAGPRDPARRRADAHRQGKSNAATRRDLAVHLWRGAGPIAGTAAERYLHGLGLVGEPLPAPLRFHPAVPAPDGYVRPTLLVPMVARGRVGGVWRVWLRELPDGIVRLDASPDDAVLGSWFGGAGEVSDGADDAGREITVVAGMALEDAIVLACAFPEQRVLALPKLADLTPLRLPNGVRTVRLAAPQLPRRTMPARAHARAVERFRRDGCSVMVVWPPDGRRDFVSMMREAAR